MVTPSLVPTLTAHACEYVYTIVETLLYCYCLQFHYWLPPNCLFTPLWLKVFHVYVAWTCLRYLWTGCPQVAAKKRSVLDLVESWNGPPCGHWDDDLVQEDALQWLWEEDGRLLYQYISTLGETSELTHKVGLHCSGGGALWWRDLAHLVWPGPQTGRTSSCQG